SVQPSGLAGGAAAGPHAIAQGFFSMSHPVVSGPSRADLEALIGASHHDPFSVLGPHEQEDGLWVRAYLPGALSAELIAEDGRLLGAMSDELAPGFYQARLEAPQRYRLRVRWAGGLHETEDPYSFGPLLGEVDTYLFSEGNHRQLGHCLGAQCLEVEGVPGVRFAVWAPNARRVSVVGDFNN